MLAKIKTKFPSPVIMDIFQLLLWNFKNSNILPNCQRFYAYMLRMHSGRKLRSIIYKVILVTKSTTHLTRRVFSQQHRLSVNSRSYVGDKTDHSFNEVNIQSTTQTQHQQSSLRSNQRSNLRLNRSRIRGRTGGRIRGLIRGRT